MSAAQDNRPHLPDIREEPAILVVDDEKLIRLTMSARLKRAGYLPVAVGTVDEAVALMKAKRHAFSAVLSDIMMGSMDGFVFRDIVRGVEPTMPFFFLTALDPEEGSGFLKRIMADPLSYYLPKAVDTEVLLKRVQQIVASRRVERFIEQQMDESRRSLALAAHIQRSMLPPRAHLGETEFYGAWWQPKDVVSGDVYDAMPFGQNRWLYILGDIQGHGTSAALAMTAVQAFLKNLGHTPGKDWVTPSDIANLIQAFFRENLPGITYMTALVCLHDLAKGEVQWISCGAPDLIVVDGGKTVGGGAASDPVRKGGLPIGLMPDTVYTRDDTVTQALSNAAVCIAVTDGVYDLSRDAEGFEQIPLQTLQRLREDLVTDALTNGAATVGAWKFITACGEFGYKVFQDDASILVFGPRQKIAGVYEAAVPLSPTAVDDASRAMGEWMQTQGWPAADVGRVQLVLEEKLMNVWDHGFDEVERLHEVVCIRLTKRRPDDAELTVWDCGTPEPSLAVAGGDAETAFELANRNLNDHGRGRLMLRELCGGIERKRYGHLNETVYHVRLETAESAEIAGGGYNPEVVNPMGTSRLHDGTGGAA